MHICLGMWKHLKRRNGKKKESWSADTHTLGHTDSRYTFWVSVNDYIKRYPGPSVALIKLFYKSKLY